MFSSTVVPKVQKQPHMFCQKAVLRNLRLGWGLFLIKLQPFGPATASNKTPEQVFSCEYCEIHKSAYFEKHLRTAATVK